MNSNLQKAVKQDQRKVKDIMPLSGPDANVIEEIMIALRNMGQDLLLIILNQYKEKPDVQILRLLKEFNADYDPVNYIEENSKVEFVEVHGVILQVNKIMSLERDQQFNYSTTDMQYRLIVNKNAPDNVFLSNKIIFFDSLQQREYEIAKLKKVLEMYNIKIV